MNELYESVDMNKLHFQYNGPTTGVSLFNIMIPKNFLIK